MLTLPEVEAKTASRRVQYQVNFRRNIELPDETVQLIVLGDAGHLPVVIGQAVSPDDHLGKLGNSMDLFPPEIG